MALGRMPGQAYLASPLQASYVVDHKRRYGSLCMSPGDDDGDNDDGDWGDQNDICPHNFAATSCSTTVSQLG